MDYKNVYVIAEAGVNHNGDLSIAKDMVFSAKEMGADAIKFQTFDPEKLVTPDLGLADYQRRAAKAASDTQLNMLRGLALDAQGFFELKNICDVIGIDFISTAFDENSIQFLSELGLERHKIPSGEITNKRFVQMVSRMGGHIYLSTGMADLDEVLRAVDWSIEVGLSPSEMTVMHCTSLYPAPAETINLKALSTLASRLDTHIGYSDHTLSMTASLGAVALGATAIEKHFTLDTNFDGPDHKASMLPNEFTTMVNSIRELELQLGTATKRPAAQELESRKAFRKSIHASKKIRRGEKLTYENLCLLRPGDGVAPYLLDSIVGSTSDRDYEQFEKFKL